MSNLLPLTYLATFLGDSGLLYRAVSLSGLVVMVGLAFLLSVNRREINWRPVFWGVGLQLILAVILLNPTLQDFFFTAVDTGVRKLISFSEEGANFVFQSVEPHSVTNASGDLEFFVGRISPPVKTFAFWILPTIVFFSSLMSILYQLGLMQRVVWVIAWVMVWVMV